MTASGATTALVRYIPARQPDLFAIGRNDINAPPMILCRSIVLSEYAALKIGSRWNEAADHPKPSMRLLPDSETYKQGEEDRDSPRRHVHQRSLLGLIAEIANQGR